MENEIIQFITNMSWASVGGLFVYYVLKPLIGMLSVRINGKDNGNLRKKVEELESSFADQMEYLENNHYRTLRREIDELKGDIKDLRTRIVNLEIKVGKLEVRVNNGKKYER